MIPSKALLLFFVHLSCLSSASFPFLESYISSLSAAEISFPWKPSNFVLFGVKDLQKQRHQDEIQETGACPDNACPLYAGISLREARQGDT